MAILTAIAIAIVVLFLAVRQTYIWTGEIRERGVYWAIIKVTIMMVGVIGWMIVLTRNERKPQ